MVKVSRIKQIEEKWDNADKWVKRILGAIATLGTIIGLVGGITGWVTAQLDAHLDAKIETIATQIQTLEEKSDEADRKLELSSTRNELTTLISHSPENVVQIEMVAKYYFLDLGGDWYMSGIYSDWAKQYGGDTSFVTHLN